MTRTRFLVGSVALALVASNCVSSTPVCAGTVGCTVPSDGTAVKVYCQDATRTMKTTTATNYVTVSCVAPSPTPSPSVTPSPSPSPKPSPSPSPTPTPSPSASPTQGPSALSAVWANDGGNKIPQDDTPATHAQVVTNSVWDGSQVKLFGAQNEVVGFNLVLESMPGANNVTVKLNDLVNGASHISSSGSDPFNWVGRNIEIFNVQYLQIKGLSALGYETYDERHVPKKLERPWTGAGNATGTWANRPDHDKFYPDIMVPIEIKPTVIVPAGKSQSVWVDIYVPKSQAPGVYSGQIQISEAGIITKLIPVSLMVNAFQLPDMPTAKTMVFASGQGDVAERFTGTRWPNCNDTNDKAVVAVKDKYFMVAHRHKISLIGEGDSACSAGGDQPPSYWLPRLSGSLFTSANGYDGPGVSTGNNVYSVGTYGNWSWKSGATAATMATHSGAWEDWFKANSPQTERFLYLVDESSNYTQTEQWAQWTKGYLPGMATLPLSAVTSVPDLMTSASWIAQAPTSWQTLYDAQKAAGKRVYFYNGKRPSNGSFTTDDDGVALRELAWAQYKKGIDRWFFWESTYYNDFQGGRGQTDVFHTAATFSGTTSIDSVKGETGWNHTNGDGLLFYPGTDKLFPASSLNAPGPIASLRMKMWRRGIQDVDYIALAMAKNPTATQALVAQMVPKALWEYGVSDPNDPTWVRSDISWSINPDDWEAARLHLSNIILTGSP